MIILTEAEFETLKRHWMAEAVKKENQKSEETLTQKTINEERRIFEMMFLNEENRNKNKIWKLRTAITPIVNICRKREQKTSHYDVTIRSEAEMAAAIDTFYQVCEFLKTLYKD